MPWTSAVRTKADPDEFAATAWGETDLAIKGLAATLLRRLYDHVKAVPDPLLLHLVGRGQGPNARVC
ncbi:hypothetical protein [Prochlorococcus sp. MIT 1303]|uniref:hypothetical protein n=1 Tax=Prochlorococcus sp. MIT 1303 TaxID=1723647 RepID=UPI001E29ED28|nr:hypothetical protein [Prochlorococcus sp. MIT 1303]